MDERLQKQLAFALEIDKEKNILRQTHLSGHGRRENDAEHAWHMAIMAYLLKEYDIAADRAIENEGKSLSVGQRKKLLIMKMLLRIEEASVLIVDEIEAGLDQETREKYEQLLNLIAKKKNKLIIVVEHDPQGTIEFTKIMHFQSGRLVNCDNFQ